MVAARYYHLTLFDIQTAFLLFHNICNVRNNEFTVAPSPANTTL